jgi:hypothetical protein
MEAKTTDEQTITLRWKVVFPIVGALILISNILNRYMSVQEYHGQQIIYNSDAQKRRIKTAVLISELETEIKMLKKELKYFQDGQIQR